MQLSDAGRPVNEKFVDIFIQSVTPDKPLTERIRRWKLDSKSLGTSEAKHHGQQHDEHPSGCTH